jgi:hypothetical protein
MTSTQNNTAPVVAVQSVVIVTAPATPTLRCASRLSNVATVAVFIVALAVPLFGFLFRTPVPLANENRPLTPPPALVPERWAVQTFPVMFEAYFNDRVGFRAELLDARRGVVFDALGDSPADLVWVGRDGWLFINNVGPFGGLPAFQQPTEPNLAAWADALADRHAYLADRGITYVVFVARDKSLVYPEYLAEKHRRHPPADPVPAVRERLRGTGVTLIDALPPLLAAKGEAPLFFARDSHWNDAGAFVGYWALAAELDAQVPGYHRKTPAAFRPERRIHPKCDLAKVVGLPPERWSEEFQFFAEPAATLVERPTAQLCARLDAAGGRLAHLDPSLFECPTAAGPPAVLLHDSFGVDLSRLMASDFRRFASVGTYGLPLPVLEAERPRVVVQEFVDRMFRIVTPTNPPEVAGYRKNVGHSLRE